MNLLIKDRLVDYIEPVYLCDPLKSFPAEDKNPQLENKTEYLKVFPNPAKNYFIAQYDLIGQQDPGILFMTDISGKILMTFLLKDNLNQIVIPIQEFPSGVYLLKLLSGNYLLDSEKLNLAR